MKNFMDENFLLTTRTARKLYYEYAAGMPIVDYHCHISPREICEDRRFDNIACLWLGADHYKWRLMRANGTEEKYITGDAPGHEKFRKWAETLEMAIGNPLYHWSHLELQRYFGYRGFLNADTADEVWELCNERLWQLTPREIIRRSHVAVIGTTDDPADTLEWHQKIKEDDSFDVQVLPTWRPERAMDTERPDYLDYLEELGQISGREIRSFSDLMEALKKRMDYFAENGCCISDHSMEYVMYAAAAQEEIEKIFSRRLSGEPLTFSDQKKFQTAFMLNMGREYARRNWAMQMHFAVRRNNNSRIYRRLGADVGADCVGNGAPVSELVDFLNDLDMTGELPRTILYSLNPADNAVIGTVIGCFQDASAAGKIQQGSAWWFNDSRQGMTEQMTSLANLGLLGNFIGMLTDSWSFLSYARHEYFRRILCELLGGWVENGEYPADMKALERIVKGISYQNAVDYFGFHVKG